MQCQHQRGAYPSPDNGEAAGFGFPPGWMQLEQVKKKKNKKNMAQDPSSETVFKITDPEWCEAHSEQSALRSRLWFNIIHCIPYFLAGLLGN